MTREAEGITVPQEKIRGERLILSLARIAGQRKSRRAAARSLQAAKKYEEVAAGYTNTQVAERGKSLLAAGQSYLNGNDIDSAARSLEPAQEDLEIYATSGTQDAYMTLSCLYPALEVVYEHRGQTDMFETVRSKAIALHAEIEKHFGIQITIGPDSSRMMMQGDPQPHME